MTYYFTIPVSEQTALAYCDLSMAQEIFELVLSDKEHLGEFLDFPEKTIEVSNQKDYIKMKLQGNAAGTDKLFCIIFEDKIVGCIDLHQINAVNQTAEIGYWIHSAYKNQGIISAVVRRLCDYAFNYLHLNKLSIFADVSNSPSNQVALKCGFAFVGTDKEEVYLHGTLRDMNKYSLLKKNFL